MSVSRNGRWLAVSASTDAASRNDLWLADLTASTPERPKLRVIQHGVAGSTSLEVGHDERLYLLTDRDAPRRRLCVASPEDPSYQSWRDLVPEDPEAVLGGYAILDGPELGHRPVLLCGWARHAVGEISVHDMRTGQRIGEAPLPGLGSIDGLSTRPDCGHEAWFGYTDHTMPLTVFRYDARTGQTSVWEDPAGRRCDAARIPNRSRDAEAAISASVGYGAQERRTKG